METKGELDIEELQQWQKDVLDSKDYLNTAWLSRYNEYDEILLTKAQANMLEKVIGDDFYIGDSKVRETLEAVFDCGFYYKKDREVLNWARENYLKGKNWIKGDS